MNTVQRKLRPALLVLLYITILANCTGPSTAKSEGKETTVAGEFTGMGGQDTLVPTENPAGEVLLKEEKLPELFYTVYTVRQGDIVGTIATAHNVSQDAIISLNKLRNTRALQIGQLLRIPSINGILYTTAKNDTPESIAAKYQISLEKLAMVNTLTDNTIAAGAVLFLPDAKLDWTTLQEINGDLFRKPLRGSYYISSRYGWRDNPFRGTRTFHNGIDMATAPGTAVYAALDGRVLETGYDVTYGNYIKIIHHSGYMSMYGHLSSILTSKGKYVTTATRIGSVGNTGLSTGPHLHFTVYKNRGTMNPAMLWN